MTASLYCPELVESQFKLLSDDLLSLIEIEESRAVGCASMRAEKFIQDKKRD